MHKRISPHGGISIPVACYYNDYIPESSLVEACFVLDNYQIVSYNNK